MDEESRQDSTPGVADEQATQEPAATTQEQPVEARVLDEEEVAQATSAVAPAAGKKHKTLLIAIITGVVALIIGIVIGFAVSGGANDASIEDDASEVEETEVDVLESLAQEYTCTWYIYDSGQDGEPESTQSVLSALISALPVPEWGEFADDESSVTLAGTIWDDSSTNVRLYLYDVSSSEFNTFIDACVDEGFELDFDKDSNSFAAYNQDDIYLDMFWFNDADELSIELTYVEGYGSDTDLIDLLDDYEDFIEEYVDFMEEYEAADYADQLDMISDYNDLLSEYEDFLDVLDTYDISDMSEDDYAYYVEVMENVDDLLADL